MYHVPARQTQARPEHRSAPSSHIIANGQAGAAPTLELPLDPRKVQYLQQTVGNRVLARMLHSGSAGRHIQRKIELPASPTTDKPKETTVYTSMDNIPPVWLHHFYSFVAVSPMHKQEYDKVVTFVLEGALKKTTIWKRGAVQEAIKKYWREELKQLPVPVPEGAEHVFTLEQLYTTVLKNFYTLAVVYINGKEVFRKRNESLEAAHAEDFVIEELNKTANWKHWWSEKVTRSTGNEIKILINNSPCFHKHGCANHLVECFNNVKDKFDHAAAMSVEFMNAYELDTGGFEKSVTAMRNGGIAVAAKAGAPFVQALLQNEQATQELLAKYNLTRDELMNLTATRMQHDAATQRALNDVTGETGNHDTDQPEEHKQSEEQKESEDGDMQSDISHDAFPSQPVIRTGQQVENRDWIDTTFREFQENNDHESLDELRQMLLANFNQVPQQWQNLYRHYIQLIDEKIGSNALT